jgi:two-component system sensor histidine kinase CreC
VKATISICSQRDGNLVSISIIDEGSGIAKYAEKKIFDTFFSLQRPDSGQKSTGLGLNFVRQVILLHGGTVTVENREPKGVRATIVLPLEKTEQSGSAKKRGTVSRIE